MRQKKFLVLSIQQLIFVIYLIITTTIFIIALNQGNDGVAIKLFGGGDDGFFYWNQARNVAAGHEWVRTSIYPLIIGYLIKITGIENVYMIRIFNYFGFILLVLLSMHLINLQFSTTNYESLGYVSKSKILLLFIYLFYPSLQMNVNLSIYRDIWIYTLYALSMILSINLIFIKQNRILNLFILILVLWLLGEFRGYALLSFILSLIIYLVFNKAKKSKKTVFIVFVLVILLALYYTWFNDMTVPIVNMSLRDVLEYRNSFLFGYAGGSQMYINLDQPTFPLFFINYIYSYIGNLLGPLPWHIHSLSTLFVFITESIPMLLVLLYLWRSRIKISDMQRYILIHAFTWISLIAMSNDNIGTATRLRPIAWILIFNVFVVMYFKNRYMKKLSV